MIKKMKNKSVALSCCPIIPRLPKRLWVFWVKLLFLIKSLACCISRTSQQTLPGRLWHCSQSNERYLFRGKYGCLVCRPRGTDILFGCSCPVLNYSRLVPVIWATFVFYFTYFHRFQVLMLICSALFLPLLSGLA